MFSITTDVTATLVFGLPVDPSNLLLIARAWSANEDALRYLDGLIDGSLIQGATGGVMLPNELLQMVKKALWVSALGEADCDTYLFFSPEDASKYHPHVCCVPWQQSQAPCAFKGCAKDRYHGNFWEVYHDKQTELSYHYPEGCSASGDQCGPCKLLKPFMKKHNVTIAHCSEAEMYLHSWIITSRASPVLQSNHDLDSPEDHYAESAIEFTAKDIQAQMANVQDLKAFAKKFDLVRKDYQGSTGLVSKSNKKAGKAPGNSRTDGPRFFLLATSNSWET